MTDAASIRSGTSARSPAFYFGAREGVLLIAVVTCAIYLPAMRGDFIMDDDALLTENTLVKSSDGWLTVWYTTHQPDYVPLTSTTLWVEWRLFGMNSTGYHVTNLLLHIASALLIWQILWKLSIPGAFLAGLLFAVHPVNVESVAWVEQLKNTQSMLFFLLSILWYLKSDPTLLDLPEQYQPRGTARWYWLSLLAFALAMCSKGSVAILPLVLLLIIWWRRGRVTGRDLLRSIPFFAVAAVLTPIIIWFVRHGSERIVRNATFLERMAQAGSVTWFYLSKALAPINLVYIYPQWHIEVHQWLWWLPLATTLIVTVVLLWRRRSGGANYSRALLFAWAFYVIALLPVVGFTDSGFAKHSLVADHYQHLAMIALVALVAASWSAWHDRAPGPGRTAAMSVAIGAVFILAYLTWQRCLIFGSPIALYEATLAQNPDSALSHNNLGNELTKVGHTQDAIEHYRRAIQLDPADAEAQNNLGWVLIITKQLPDAIDHFEQALSLRPNYAKAHNNLGIALQKMGKLPEAIDHYKQALEFNPNYAKAYANLALAYSQINQPPEAIDAAEKAIDLAREQGQPAMAQQLESWLGAYLSGKRPPEQPSGR